jgi:glyceraldehyde-3-phosphate dehydrogenase (NAD(P))
VLERLRANRKVAVTERRSANQIFSFGRDHGYYGRILSQTVISSPTDLGPRRQRDPRLLLHAAGRQLARLLDQAALWLIDPEPKQLAERMAVMDRFFFGRSDPARGR